MTLKYRGMFRGRGSMKKQMGNLPYQDYSFNKQSTISYHGASLYYSHKPSCHNNRRGTKKTYRAELSQQQNRQRKQKQTLTSGAIGRPLPLVQINSSFSKTYLFIFGNNIEYAIFCSSDIIKLGFLPSSPYP